MAKGHAHSDPSSKVRRELADKIHFLSVDSPPDYFQMILPHNHDGRPGHRHRGIVGGGRRMNAMRIQNTESQRAQRPASFLCALRASVFPNTGLFRDLLLPKLNSGLLDMADLDIDTGEPLVEADA